MVEEADSFRELGKVSGLISGEELREMMLDENSSPRVTLGAAILATIGGKREAIGVSQDVVFCYRERQLFNRGHLFDGDWLAKLAQRWGELLSDDDERGWRMTADLAIETGSAFSEGSLSKKAKICLAKAGEKIWEREGRRRWDNFDYFWSLEGEGWEIEKVQRELERVLPPAWLGKRVVFETNQRLAGELRELILNREEMQTAKRLTLAWAMIDKGLEVGMDDLFCLGREIGKEKMPEAFFVTFYNYFSKKVGTQGDEGQRLKYIAFLREKGRGAEVFWFLASYLWEETESDL